MEQYSNEDVISKTKMIKFESGKKEYLATIKATRGSNFTNDELLALWSFNNHTNRLVKFIRPFYKEMIISYAMPTNEKATSNKNVPTELRLSAAINELRPFMLNGDSINFYKTVGVIHKQFRGNVEFEECMKWYKQLWRRYDINVNNKHAARINTRYDIDNISITTYPELLRIFMYGKYIHNNDNPKSTAIVYRIEKSLYYPSIKAELGVCISHICNILCIFNGDFVKPVLKIHKNTIRSLNWQSINKGAANRKFCL